MNTSKKDIFMKTLKSLYGIGYLTLFLAGLAFFLAATINIAMDKKQSVEYKETVATFSRTRKIESYDASDDRYETEYEGIYKFEVNGQTYEASPTYTKGSTNFKKTLKIKYDPTDPGAYIVVGEHYTDYLIALVLWVILIICIRNGYITQKKLMEYYSTHPN